MPYAIVNPATEQVVGEAPEDSVEQVEAAAAAAAAEAFPAWSRTTPEERAALLDRAGDLIRDHIDELIPLVQAETGATMRVAKTMQVPTCVERLPPLRPWRSRAERHPAAAGRDADDRARARWAHGRDRRAPAGRRRRVHHAVQLPDRQHGRARSVRRSRWATRSS